jgi:hypothetical protein
MNGKRTANSFVVPPVSYLTITVAVEGKVASTTRLEMCEFLVPVVTLGALIREFCRNAPIVLVGFVVASLGFLLFAFSHG